MPQALRTLSSAQKRSLLKRLIRRRSRIRSGRVDATTGQAAMYLLQNEESQSDMFALYALVGIRGPLDLVRLREAVAALGRRHPLINTRCELDTSALQLVVNEADLALQRRSVDSAGELERAAVAAGKGHFDASETLSRFVLLSTTDMAGGGEHVLVCAAHHIVADYRAITLFVDDLWRLYAASPSASAEPQTAAAIDVALRAERTFLASPAADEERTFWRDYLDGAAPLLDLPVRLPRRPVRRSIGESMPFAVDAGLTEQLRALAREAECSLYTVLLGGWSLMLHLYSGSDDVVVGSPVDLRELPRMRDSVGYHINMLPLRARLEADVSLAEFLSALKHSVAAAMRRRRLPFSEIVAACDTPRSAACTPVFQSVFTLQSLPTEGLMRRLILAQRGAEAVDHAGLELRLIDEALQAGQFDLALEATLAEGELHGYVKYNSDVFGAALAGRMRETFSAVLRLLVEAPGLNTRELAARLFGTAPQALQRTKKLDNGGPAAAGECDFNSRDYLLHLLNAGHAGMSAPASVCLTGEFPSVYLLRRHFYLYPNTALRYECRSGGVTVLRRDFTAADADEYRLPHCRMAPEIDLAIVDADGRPTAPGAAGRLQPAAGGCELPDDAHCLRARLSDAGEIELLGTRGYLTRSGFVFEEHELRAAVEQHPEVAWAELLVPAAEAGDAAQVLNELTVRITPAANAPLPELGALRRFLRRRLAAWMLPDALESDLPTIYGNPPGDDFEEGEI